MRYYEDLPLNEFQHTNNYTMEKQEIMEFAGRWDPQPFHTDEEEAKKWPLGLTASSVHTIAASVKLAQEMSMSKQQTAVVAGLGWDNVRMPHPVRPNDVIRVKAWMSEKRDSNSRPDCGIVTSQFEVYNQDDVMVLSYSIASLVMKRPVESAT